jgi:hypothetical protein
MKKSFKYLILGIGIGLIISSFFAVPAKKPVNENNKPDFINPEVLAHNSTELDKENEIVLGEPDGDAEYNGALAGETGNSTTKTEDETTELPNDPEGYYVEITIPYGTKSYSVARILYKNNLINSMDEFERRLIELGVDKKIQVGEYKIKMGSSLDEIIDIIVKQVENQK